MPKRTYKEAVAYLEDLGYELDRVNSKGFHIFSHCQHGEISVSPSVDEKSKRNLIRRVDKLCGVEREINKRNPAAVRERQAAEREAMKANLSRLDAERERLIAQREQQLDGLGAMLTPVEVRAISEHIEALDRQRREIERLMRGEPGRDRTARHEAGRR